MIFIYLIAIFAKSNDEISKLISSRLFLHNSSILYSSKGILEMPGNLITIPALTRYRIFSIQNLYVHKNFDHLITNSALLQNFQLKVSSCFFSKFLKSPISMNFEYNYLQRADNNEISGQIFNNTLNFENSITLSITNCSFINCTSSSSGGAIYIKSLNDIKIERCNFRSCSSANSGGAIFISLSKKIEVTICDFKNCSTSRYGGGIYIENVEDSIYLSFVNFIGCISTDVAGGGMSIINSNFLYLGNILFNECQLTQNYRSYGCGASLLRVSNIKVHKIKTINCHATFGSGIDINMHSAVFNNKLITRMTNLSGDYLSGEDCINNRGIYCFCATRFNNLTRINLTDTNTQVDLRRYLLYFNMCEGQINNFNFTVLNDTATRCFWFEKTDLPNLNKNDNYNLLLNCLGSSPKIDTILVYQNVDQVKNIFNITFKNYDLFEHIDAMPTSEFVHFSNDDSGKLECYSLIPTNSFTQTEEFTVSIEFTKSDIFKDSSPFTYSFYFTKSDDFTSSQGFTETEYFTYTSGFSDSIYFTESDRFTQSGELIYTSTFTPSNHFLHSLGFTIFRTQISNPQKTLYNIGFSEKDGKGTKTDQGFVFAYICVALLVLCFIISVVFAVCKCRKPTPEESLTPEDRDEFYFPDFENLN